MTEDNTIQPDEGAEDSAADNDASSDFAQFEDDFGDGSALLQTQEELERTKDELARARAEVYNVRQEYGNYVRRTKEEASRRQQEAMEAVVETLLPVLDDIEAARAAGDLADGPFAAIADKLEDLLGLTPFGEAGEDFDPMVHEALMARPTPEVDHEVIGQVLQRGIKVGDRVLRPAKVIVNTPA